MPKYLPIILSEELTGATAFEFADGLALHGFDTYAGIVLELDENSRIDVNGMAVLLRIHSHLRGRGKELYVRGANEQIARGIKRLGLERVLNTPPIPRRSEWNTQSDLNALTGETKVLRD